MTYTATPEDIQKIRYELNDNSAGLYILDDSTITYYLEKNEGSIGRTTIDGARAILFRLSMDAKDQVVDVISLKNSKQAEAYRQALLLFISNPSLNPLYNNLSGWAGGVSLSEMRLNNETIDNNVSSLSTNEKYPRTVNDIVYDSNPFAV